MSEAPTPNTQPKTTAPKSILPEGDDRKKWLIGGGAAVILLVGGYLGWSALNNPSPQTSNVAYNAAAAGPYADNGDENAPSAAPTETSAADEASAAPQTTSTTTPAPRRVTTASRTDDAVEATIGVAPASTDENEIVVTGPRRPNWARTPSARRLSTLYPTRALERGREGEASLRCTVQTSGDLNCQRVSEYPANAGFGRAALRVASTFQHAPERSDGRSAIGSRVNLRVLFRLADDARRR